MGLQGEGLVLISALPLPTVAPGGSLSPGLCLSVCELETLGRGVIWEGHCVLAHAGTWRVLGTRWPQGWVTATRGDPSWCGAAWADCMLSLHGAKASLGWGWCCAPPQKVCPSSAARGS